MHRSLVAAEPEVSLHAEIPAKFAGAQLPRVISNSDQHGNAKPQHAGKNDDNIFILTSITDMSCVVCDSVGMFPYKVAAGEAQGEPDGAAQGSVRGRDQGAEGEAQGAGRRDA